MIKKIGLFWSKFFVNHSRDLKSLKKFILNRLTIDLKSYRRNIETKMYNDIIVFDDKQKSQKFEHLIKKYDVFWKKQNFCVKIFKSVFMFITLKSDWADRLKMNRVYFLNLKNQFFINKTFDKLHEQKKMKWSKNSIFFDYFVFVVWRTVHQKKNQSEKNAQW